MNKLTLGIVVAIFSTSANADYKFRDLHSSSDPFSSAFAINNSNQVVGSQSVKVGPVAWTVPTLWNVETGSTTYLTIPKVNFLGYASDINNRGDIVASVTDYFDPNLNGYFFHNGTSEVIKLPAATYPIVQNLEINNAGQFIGTTYPNPGFGSTLWKNPSNPVVLGKIVNGFNDNSQMVGQSIFSGEKHATLFNGNISVDLGKGFKWAGSSEAIDINNNGQVIATGSGLEGGYRSFIWENGVTRSLMSSGNSSEATSINELGIVVGNQFTHLPIYTPGYFYLQTEAVIWDGHNQYRLNDFLDTKTKEDGWVLVTANDINDNGWIVGTAYNTLTSEHHAYLLSTDNPLAPIPEPSTYLLLLAGLGVLGFMGRKEIAK